MLEQKRVCSWEHKGLFMFNSSVSQVMITSVEA